MKVRNALLAHSGPLWDRLNKCVSVSLQREVRGYPCVRDCIRTQVSLSFCVNIPITTVHTVIHISRYYMDIHIFINCIKMYDPTNMHLQPLCKCRSQGSLSERNKKTGMQLRWAGRLQQGYDEIRWLRFWGMATERSEKWQLGVMLWVKRKPCVSQRIFCEKAWNRQTSYLHWRESSSSQNILMHNDFTAALCCFWATYFICFSLTFAKYCNKGIRRQ